MYLAIYFTEDRVARIIVINTNMALRARWFISKKQISNG